MKKWLTPGGLSAVFLDAAIIPYSFSKLMVEAGKKSRSMGLGPAAMVSMGHMPFLFMATLGFFAGGPAGAVAGYYVGLLGFTATIAAMNEKNQNFLWPRTSAYADEIAEPPAPKLR